MNRSPLRLASLPSLLLLVGCQSAAPHEKSVRPGINDPYRAPKVAEWVQRFETESREIYRERARLVADLRLARGAGLADVGAGTGLFTPLLSDAVGPDGRVYAIDIVPEFIRHIETRAREAGLTNVSPVLCREDSIELPADSIDVAFICDTYHHFEYPKSTLASIHRALRRGGRVVIVDFKRVPGESSEWVLQHVRAGREEFAAEVVAAGFVQVDSPPTDYLTENYRIEFRKP